MNDPATKTWRSAFVRATSIAWFIWKSVCPNYKGAVPNKPGALIILELMPNLHIKDAKQLVTTSYRVGYGLTFLAGVPLPAVLFAVEDGLYAYACM